MKYSINYKQEILGSLHERPGTPASLIDDLINIKETLEKNVQNSPGVYYEKQTVRGEVTLVQWNQNGNYSLDYVGYAVTIQKENKIRVKFTVGYKQNARTFKHKHLALIAIEQFEKNPVIP